jgi:hypothetical protein
VAPTSDFGMRVQDWMSQLALTRKPALHDVGQDGLHGRRKSARLLQSTARVGQQRCRHWIAQVARAKPVLSSANPASAMLSLLGIAMADQQVRAVARESSSACRRHAAHSVVGRAVEHGSLYMPRRLLDSLFRALRDGYRVYAFEANARHGGSLGAWSECRYDGAFLAPRQPCPTATLPSTPRVICVA